MGAQLRPRRVTTRSRIRWFEALAGRRLRRPAIHRSGHTPELGKKWEKGDRFIFRSLDNEDLLKERLKGEVSGVGNTELDGRNISDSQPLGGSRYLFPRYGFNYLFKSSYQRFA